MLKNRHHKLLNYRCDLEEGERFVRQHLEIALFNSARISGHQIINFHHFDEEGQLELMEDLVHSFENQLEILHDIHDRLKQIDMEVKGFVSKHRQASVIQLFDKIHAEMSELERKLCLCTDNEVCSEVTHAHINWLDVEDQLNCIANVLNRWFRNTIKGVLFQKKKCFL